ncbi:hypothetical protein HDU83_006029 [Entophlyctis luteolus]|nr:hypothetical protein HDU83_006029 [Entophlyctis luteolus]
MNDTLLLASAAVGAAVALSYIASFLRTVVDAYLIPGKTLKSFGAVPGTWVVVTGGSDGIGREFAEQLSQRHSLNVLLVARNKTKLDNARDEIASKVRSGVSVKTHVMDFASAGPAEYAGLRKALTELGGKVSVLINNVAVNHEFPVSFLDESETTIESIVKVNISSQLAVTRIVAPLMVTERKGLILNIGSLAGIVPSALLSVYSASKAFFRFWSDALALELAPAGVHVQHVRAFFVVTAMSKIRKPTWTTPTPKLFVRSVLANLGKDIDSAPFPSHALLMWVMDKLMGERFWMNQSNTMHIDIRKRALKKKERDAAAAASASGKKSL